MTITRQEWLSTLQKNQQQMIRWEPGPDDHAALERVFPNVDPGVYPFGTRVLVQLRLERSQSRGGIALVQETKDTERWNEAVAQIIALGPLAFRKRDTLQPWAEGMWAEVGDFVRVPKFGGDRWEVAVDDQDAVDRHQKRIEQIEAELRELRDPEAVRDATLRRVEERSYSLQTELKQLKARDPDMLQVVFAQFNDYELIGEITGSPLDMKVYV